MKYLARLSADPVFWLFLLMILTIAGTVVYVILTSITF